MRSSGHEAVEIGVGAKERLEIGQRLNALLADEFVLYVKCRNYHWNVVGPSFKPLHEFFEEQYEKVDEIIDEVAERARQLGSLARGSMKAYIAQTRLKESVEGISASEMLEHLCSDHEAICRKLREDVDFCNQARDHATANFLSELLERHEKMAWMNRAHLEKP